VFLDVCSYLTQSGEILAMPDLGPNQNQDGTLIDPLKNADGTLIVKVETPPPGLSKEDAAFLKEAARLGNEAASIQSRRNQELEAELEALKGKAKDDTPAISKDDFYADPVNAVKRLMEEAVAPLKEAAQGLAYGSAYEKLKNKYRNNPKFKSVFEKAEHLIDDAMGKVAPTEQNLQFTLYSIRGAAAFGDLGNDINFDEKPIAPVIPPVSGAIPPSASPRPEPQVPKMRQLTESEKRLAKSRNLSDEAYLAIVDGTDEVSFDHINATLKTGEQK
jgi:hypothetical protein